MPRIPQRLAYLTWIKETLIDTENVSGFDIGVGANCIYPILGVTRFGWKMKGSECNKESLEWAEE